MFSEQPSPNEKPRIFPHTLFAFISIIGIFFFYQFNGALLVQWAETQGAFVSLLVQGLGQLSFMLLPALYLMRFSPLGGNRLLRIDAPSIQPKHWIVAIGGIALVQLFSYGWLSLQTYLLPSAIMDALHEYSRVISEKTEELFGSGSPYPVVVVVVAIIPGFAEEVLFRGLMQRSLEQSLGIPLAITFTALFFALVHLNPELFLPLVVIGVLLGVLAVSSRSLLPAMVCHFTNNLLSVSASRNSEAQAFDSAASSLDIPSALLCLGVSLLLLALAVLWLMKKTPSPKSS